MLPHSRTMQLGWGVGQGLVLGEITREVVTLDAVKKNLCPRKKSNQKFLSLQLCLPTGILLYVFLGKIQQFVKLFPYICKHIRCEEDGSNRNLTCGHVSTGMRTLLVNWVRDTDRRQLKHR